MPETNAAEGSTAGSTPPGGAASSPATPSSSPADSAAGSSAPSSRGATVIADVVVAKIAGIATREVGGVHAVGGGAARVVGAIRERIPGARTNATQGITVEVGEIQAAVDVSIIADYGIAIHELADAVRQNIIFAVEGMTGLEVTEVNVEISDVHVPGDEDDDEDEPHSRPAAVEGRPRVQ